MGFDTETAMGNAARDALKDTLGNGHSEVLTEFSYGAGKTDLVTANISSTYLQRRVQDLDLDRPIEPAYLKAFLLVHRREKITRQYFEELYSGPKEADTVLNWLRSHGFIQYTDGEKIRTAQNLRRHVTTSYAIELKLSKWRKALKQAYRAKSYADYQFVAIDSAHVGPALDHEDVFEKYNVGLISINESGECRIHHRPDRQSPVTPLIAWNLNERTLKVPTFNQAAD